MIGVIGIFIAIIVLIVLIYHKYNPILCVLFASLIVGLSNGKGLWEIYLNHFTKGMLGFMEPILLLFILSAIYGKLMTRTGSATRIANLLNDVLGEKYSILAFICSVALLVYGGISVFTVIFAIYPIGLMILKKNKIPLYLLPAIITIGQITFSMTALPGTPQMNNIIPAQYFGTTLMAAPVLGCICALLMLVLSYAYIMHIIRKVKTDCEDMQEINENSMPDYGIISVGCPPFWKSILPMIVLFTVYFVLSNNIIENTMDVYQSVNTAMLFALFIMIILHRKNREAIKMAVEEGCNDWIKPLINLSVIIGFGAVVKSTDGFKICVDTLLGLHLNTYFSAAICTAAVSAITGSASGGIQIACSTFSEVWLMSANPQILHRICSIASCAMDSLPHSGGIYSTFEICGVELRKGYPYVFVVTVLIPSLVTIIAVILANMGVC